MPLLLEKGLLNGSFPHGILPKSSLVVPNKSLPLNTFGAFLDTLDAPKTPRIPASFLCHYHPLSLGRIYIYI
jgi:hypothetical protein